MLRILRKLLLIFAYLIGQQRRSVCRKKYIALTYHGLFEEPAAEPVEKSFRYNIDVREFEYQLMYLTKFCDWQRFSNNELYTVCAAAGRSGRAFLTFDDGYSSVYKYGFPVLKKYNIPAIIFLTTEFVFDRQPLWHDVLQYIFRETRQTEVTLRLGNNEDEYDLSSMPQRISAFQAAIKYFARLGSGSGRDSRITALADYLQVSVDPQVVLQEESKRPLTERELRDMLDSGLVTLGSHGVKHYSLEYCTSETTAAELCDSKQIIEAFCKRPCFHYALPGGAVNTDILTRARAAGYEMVCDSNAHLVDLGLEDKLFHRYCLFQGMSTYIFANYIGLRW